jgi:hypothetical protein
MESEKDRKIRERAYELWEQSGRPEGQAEQHWRVAEREFSAGDEGPPAGERAGASRPAPKRSRAVEPEAKRKTAAAKAGAPAKKTAAGEAAANGKVGRASTAKASSSGRSSASGSKKA